MVAFGAPLLLQFQLIAIAFWFGAAIPTSIIAKRFGHPLWMAYVLWCPFLVPLLMMFLHLGFLGFLAFFFWVPGVTYLWVLALKRGAVA